MTSNEQFVYKVCKKLEWVKAKETRKYLGSDKDIYDGFIHFSTKRELKSTIEKYFSKEKNLIILKVDVNLLDNLKWEKSRDGLLFPHLYSKFNLDSIQEIYKMNILEDGILSIPNSF